MDNRQTHSAFQNELQNILSDLLLENMGRNTLYRRNQNQDNMFSLIQCLRETITSYNQNIRDYGSNIRLYLQILELLIRQEQNQLRSPIIEPIVQPSAPRRQRERTRDQQRPPTPTQNHFLSYLIYPLRDISGNTLRTPAQTQQFQNVIVRPTTEQINNATSTMQYDASLNLINHQCPIRLDNFENGENIRRILRCGHTFCEESFQQWFQSNVRCPVCRHDIRQHDNSGNSTDQSELEITNRMLNGLTANITNIINNYVNNAESENVDMEYNFEIPLYYNDLSSNFY
jgi:hypothetical protein